MREERGEIGPFGKGWSTIMGQKAVLSAIVGSVIVLLAGCANSSSQEQQKAYTPHIDPADFTTKVDNEYFPMKPGTTFVYEGGAERDEMSVTHDTKKVMVWSAWWSMTGLGKAAS